MRTRSYVGADHHSWWSPFRSDQLAVTRSDPLESQISHFIAVIEGADTPRVSPRDGYANMLVLEAIKRSISSGASERVSGVG